jgi:ABC-type polysaccharide/polyol phosphate export permease
MPGWLASAAAWNPLSAVADALRYALLGAGAAPSWRAVAAMAIAACAILAAASLEMARARRA